MAGLCGGVDDGVRPDLLHQRQDARAVADVQFVVPEARQVARQPLLVPSGVARRAEKDGALVVVDAVDAIAEFTREVRADFGTDQAGGSGDEAVFSWVNAAGAGQGGD